MNQAMICDSDPRPGVYATHRARLVDYATPILGSREAAEDVVQDAFIRFAPERFRGTASEQVVAYLYRVVRNLSFDRLKRRKVEQRHGAENVPFWAIPAAQPTPDESLLICEQMRLVHQVLSEFPSEVRIAVEMNRFGGFTLEEIAAHLDISVATAHRHVRKVMVALALRLDHHA